MIPIRVRKPNDELRRAMAQSEADAKILQRLCYGLAALIPFAIALLIVSLPTS